MLLALWLIFARAGRRIAKIFEQITGENVSIDEACSTLKNILDKAYDEMKRDKNETSETHK